MATSIPRKSLVEIDLPIENLFELCIREGNRKRPVYQMHKWWSRRLGSVFRLILMASVLPSGTTKRRLWSRFYSKNDLSTITVLDPFMGGGTSIVEATKCRARTIGVDIDPVACFVSRKEIEGCDISQLREGFEEIRRSVAPRVLAYYRTRVSNGRMADVIYYFWVDIVVCPNCAREFEGHPNYLLGYDEPAKRLHVFCSGCHAIGALKPNARSFQCDECRTTTTLRSGTVRNGKFTCPHCHTTGRMINTSSVGTRRRKRLFAVEYETPETRGRAYKRAARSSR